MTPVTAILTGPTASGKTAIALEFARAHPQIEIINGDSLLFYKGLNIGTAKPTAAELAEVPHHLIDVISPDETFTAGDFYRSAQQTIETLHQKGKRALIVGGSGFYLKALVYGLWDAPKADPELRKQLEQRTSKDLYDELYVKDEEAALRIGVNDRYRLVRAHEIIAQSGSTPSALKATLETQNPDPNMDLLWIDRDAAELDQRIQHRTQEMLKTGLLDETRWLMTQHPHSRTLQAIGYDETRTYLQGNRPAGRKIREGLEGLADEINLSTRQLVKKQRTFFRNQFQHATTYILDRDREALLAHLAKVYP